MVSGGGSGREGAYAATVVAQRAASWRADQSAGDGRTHANSSPSAADRAHRERVSQPAADVGPWLLQGLTSDRTVAGDNISNPNRARAHTMAPAVYSRPLRVSAGATVVTARQAVHR